MKAWAPALLVWLAWVLTGTAQGHFTGKGHVHHLAETKRAFTNPDCQLTDSCDLKRFTLTQIDYEVWFSDDPVRPTYGTGVIMEYETKSVDTLENYAIVQFVKGCIFHTSQNQAGVIRQQIYDTVKSFDEYVPFCFPRWVIDSQDSDPVYNSDPTHGRIHLARWNIPGSYDYRTQKFFGIQRPKRPVVYMTDYPSGAFITGTGVKNSALEFKTCIYKAADVPAQTRRDDIHFAKSLACHNWRNVYIYDFVQAKFQSDLALMPKWEEPADQAADRGPAKTPWLPVALIMTVAGLLVLVQRRRKLARRG